MALRGQVGVLAVHLVDQQVGVGGHDQRGWRPSAPPPATRTPRSRRRPTTTRRRARTGPGARRRLPTCRRTAAPAAAQGCASGARAAAYGGGCAVAGADWRRRLGLPGGGASRSPGAGAGRPRAAAARRGGRPGVRGVRLPVGLRTRGAGAIPSNQSRAGASHSMTADTATSEDRKPPMTKPAQEQRARARTVSASRAPRLRLSTWIAEDRGRRGAPGRDHRQRAHDGERTLERRGRARRRAARTGTPGRPPGSPAGGGWRPARRRRRRRAPSPAMIIQAAMVTWRGRSSFVSVIVSSIGSRGDLRVSSALRRLALASDVDDHAAAVDDARPRSAASPAGRRSRSGSAAAAGGRRTPGRSRSRRARSRAASVTLIVIRRTASRFSSSASCRSTMCASSSRVSASKMTISSSRLRNSGLNDWRTTPSTDSCFFSGSSVGSTR